MDMSADDVVRAGKNALAGGQGLDVVLDAVTQASSGRLMQIIRLRAITGLGLLDTQLVLFSDRDLTHLGLPELDLIHTFPWLTGEYAATIRRLYVKAVIRDEPWLGAAPLDDEEPGVSYWRGRERAPAAARGGLYGSGFDTFRAEIRAVPGVPPRIAVVTDTPQLLTCRFALSTRHRDGRGSV